MGGVLSLMGAVALPLGSGFAVGLATQGDIKGWYEGLKKPSWNPPNWLFPPAWATLYSSMGVASWFVMRSGKGGRALPITLYLTQLALNLAWTPLFFNRHWADAALADSVAVLGLATAATVKMADKAGGKVIYPLMVPYLMWVTFATALTGEIWRLNPNETAIDYKALKKDVKAAGDKAAARAKEDTKKVAAAAKQTADKAAEKAKETGAAVAAKAEEAKQKVAAAADEVAKKAQHDAAELAAVVKDGVAGSSAAPSAPPSAPAM